MYTNHFTRLDIDDLYTHLVKFQDISEFACAIKNK